jgi:hypothetical protein
MGGLGAVISKPTDMGLLNMPGAAPGNTLVPPAAGGGISVVPGTGIDCDVVAENLFPHVAWLREYGMRMYRWSGT